MIPTLPAGTLPLLWVSVFLLGVSLMLYTGLCNGRDDCIDPRAIDARAILTSISERIERMDGEGASEIFERARASVAPTADYVAEKLSQIWGKICAGEISELSQLLTDRDIRIAVIMYIGTVIACAGGYLTFATMDGSPSFAQYVSTFSAADQLASVTERFEANSAAFTQWREATTASVTAVMREREAREEEDSAPTPPFSLSSFCIVTVRGLLWLFRAAKGFFNKEKQEKVEKVESKNAGREKDNEKSEELNYINTSESHAHPAAPSSRAPLRDDTDTGDTPIMSPRTLSSLSPARLRSQFTIFLRAKKPSLPSFLQRLDVTAGIVSMLSLLLLVFLYHKRIKAFLKLSLSVCTVPAIVVVVCFFMGKMSYTAYRWVSDRRLLRNMQISLVSTFAKRLLNCKHNGGPYPVDFLFEEMKDTIADGIVDVSVAGIPSPFKKKRVSFCIPTDASGPSSPMNNDQHGKYDKYNTYGELGEGDEVDLKLLKALWPDVQKDVLTDKRVLSVDMIFEGARRRCWKSMGARLSVSPVPVSNRAAAATVLSANKSKRGWTVAGWTMFSVELAVWGLAGLLRGVWYVVCRIWTWLRQ